jgi:sec-independent protein translocase protein TatA
MPLGAPELIIIALVILALFGYRKLPDAARAIGRSMRIFKAETKGLREEPAPRHLDAKAEAEYVRDQAEAPRPTSQPPPAPQPPSQPAPPAAAAPGQATAPAQPAPPAAAAQPAAPAQPAPPPTAEPQQFSAPTSEPR